jgi:putative ABC transport system permease protein
MISASRQIGRMVAPLGIPLAWRQLMNEKKRMLAAVLGITFGVMLMLFQLGLYRGILAMAVLPHISLRGDLVLVSPGYEYFGSSLQFSRRRLQQAQSLPEVQATAPLYAGFLHWWNPVDGSVQAIFAMGIEPGRNPFTLPEIAEQINEIRDPESVLFDRLSAPEFGPVPALLHDHGMVQTEANNKRVRVRGLFSLGPTLSSSANLVMSDEAFFRVRTDKPRNMADVGLIWLRPNADREVVLRRLRELLPRDVEILRREEFIRNEQDYWAKRTPVGFIAAAGLLVGMLVGGIVIYQILYTDVNDHLRQYATLKAIGISDGFFLGLVLQEACILMLLGFVPALLLTLALNYEARIRAQIPTTLTPRDGAIVFLAIAAVSSIAGLLASRRLRTADPADVF